MDKFRTHTQTSNSHVPPFSVTPCIILQSPSCSVNTNIDTDNKMTFASDKRFGLVDSCHEAWRRIQQYAETGKF